MLTLIRLENVQILISWHVVGLEWKKIVQFLLVSSLEFRIQWDNILRDDSMHEIREQSFIMTEDWGDAKFAFETEQNDSLFMSQRKYAPK